MLEVEIAILIIFTIIVVATAKHTELKKIFYNMKKEGYIVVHLLKFIGGSYWEYETRIYPLSTKFIELKDNRYVVNLNDVIFKKTKFGEEPHIYLDMDKCFPLSFKSNIKIASSTYKAITESDILQKFLSRRAEKQFMLLMLIMGAIIIIEAFGIIYLISKLNPTVASTVIPPPPKG
ncbi:MAG: hypothetical protein QXE05_04830 [Nitrososphaeria archaeon]